MNRGFIDITGTDGHDRVQVLQSGSGDSAILRIIEQQVDDRGRRVGAKTVTQFDLKDVRHIVFDGKDGHDLFSYTWTTSNKDQAVWTSLSGGEGNDTLYGGPKDDYIYGGKGQDKMMGHDGNDEIVGGEGNDFLWGNAGNDTLRGGNGNDYMDGGADNDEIHGEEDLPWQPDADKSKFRDTIYGGSGRDEIYMPYWEQQGKNSVAKFWEDHWADRRRNDGDTVHELKMIYLF